MSDALEIVKQANAAFESKDFEKARQFIHPQYTCRAPLMDCNSPEELFSMMQDSPFVCGADNLSFIAQGNEVVQFFDWVSNAPISFRVRMCSHMTIEDGKIRSEEMLYDTGQLPQEALDLLKQRTLKKAA